MSHESAGYLKRASRNS